jgi:uncharacterized delta-60 repeat protein
MSTRMNTPHLKGIPKPVFRLFFSLLFLLPFTIAALAQSGPVDPTFAPNFTFAGRVSQVVVQPDGKLLVVGFFREANGVTVSMGVFPQPRLVRLNPDGSLDPSFQISQTLAIQTVALLPDGKILFGGGVFNSTPVGKLNADGTLDSTFTADTSRVGSVEALAVQPDGKILVGGGITTFDPNSPSPQQRPLNRLNADGSLDTSFTPPSFETFGFVNTIALSGPKIVLGVSGAQNGFQIVGLNADGTPNSGFNVPALTTTGFTGLSNITSLSDGKFLLAGFFNSVGGSSRNGIARLNSDGTLDQTFNPGTGVTGNVSTVFLLPGGKILLGGLFTQFNGVSRQNIARINADGSLDETFNPSGGANFIVNAFARLSDGRLLIGGGFSTFAGLPRTGLVQTLADGTPNREFSVNLRGLVSTGRITVQSDDKVVVVGSFNIVNGVNQVNITRLNPDGTTDPGFLANASVLGFVNALAVQADGKILVGGGFVGVNGVPRSDVARLNADGTLDTTFVPASSVQNIQALAPQSDGKVVIGGFVTTVGGVARASLARLNADGSLDTTFVPPGDISLNTPLQITVQPDGKILVGGSGPSLVRLNANGSLDTGFTLPFQNGGFNEFILQPDGRIVLTASTDGTLQRPGFLIFRVNADGSLDSSFNQQFIPVTGRRRIRSAPGNRLVVTGDFIMGIPESAPIISRTYIFRLNSDGTFDSTFSSTLGATGSTNDVGVQSDGRIILSGGFSSFGGTPIASGRTLIRLNATTTSNCSFAVSPTSFNFTQAGGQGTFTVTTGTDCVWTTTQPPVWIERVPGIGADTRTIQFRVRPNTGAARSATFTVAGQTVTVNQAATGNGSAGAFRPSTGFVFLRNTNDTGVADTQFFYGQASDVPVVGDWDGNGTDTVGIYRDGTFFLRNSNSSGFADIQFPFGQPGDIPIAGDWDGDGIDTVGIIRGSEVFLRNSNTAGDAQVQFFYGQAGDIYLAGDWNGDGIDSIGAYRPSNGFVYLRNFNFSGFADIEFFYGAAGDKPVVGDWNNDGVDTIGVVRGNRWLLRNSNTEGFAEIEFNYGLDSDIPIAGDWNGLP